MKTLETHSGSKVHLIIVGFTAIFLLSSCMSVQQIVESQARPFTLQQVFTAEEVDAGLGRLGAAAEVRLWGTGDEIPGFEPSLRSLDGYTNGAVYVQELERPEPENGNEPVWRELLMFRGTTPLLFEEEFDTYRLVLVDAVSYPQRGEDGLEIPERTHLGLIQVTVPAAPREFEGNLYGNGIINWRETGQPMTRDGRTIPAFFYTEELESAFRRAEFSMYDPAIAAGAVLSQTLFHPGLDRLPKPIDPYFASLPEISLPYGSVAAGHDSDPPVPVELTVIRNDTAIIGRNGFEVGRRTVYEAFTIGEHNVYVAAVLNGSGRLYDEGRSVAGNTGTVGFAVVVFDSAESLSAALRGAKDPAGFDVITGLNDAGFRQDGSTEDGRFFTGTITKDGRAGYGTTFFPDGRTLTGTYQQDKLTGLALELLPDDTRIYGIWDGETKDGNYIVLDPTDGGSIVTYTNDAPSGARPYESQLGSPDWIWLSDAIAQAPADAVRVDGEARLVARGAENVEVRYSDGLVYHGPFEPNVVVEGLINYPDGRRYEGEVVGGLPNGQGTMYLQDGSEMNGTFVDGTPDGDMILLDAAGARTITFYKGELVDSPDEEREEKPKQDLMTPAEYVRSATTGYHEYVDAVTAQRRAERAQFWGDVASVAFDVLEVSMSALESYNEELQRQESLTSAPGYDTSTARAANSANPPYWSRIGGRPTVGRDSVQLATIVETADRYYDQYLNALRSGDSVRAAQMYDGHRASVLKARDLLSLSSGTERTFNLDDETSSRHEEAVPSQPSTGTTGTNPCADYDGPGECAQEQ